MSEIQVEPPDGLRPITFRNQCSAGCGREHSPAGKEPATMVPDIGYICSECMSDGGAAFIENHPQQSMHIPHYRRKDT